MNPVIHLALCTFRARLKSTLFNILLITTAIGGLMIIAGFGLFTYDSLESRSARETGHLILSHKDYFDKSESGVMSLGIEDYLVYKKKFEELPLVDSVLPEIQFQGLLANDSKSVGYLGSGLTAAELRLRGPFLEITAGKLISTRYKPEADPQIILGSKLAANLGAKPGDSLTLMSTTTEESLNGFDVVVVGIVETGVPAIDERLVYTHFELVQELLQTDKVHQLKIYLEGLQGLSGVPDSLQNEGKAQVRAALEELGTTEPNKADLGITEWYDRAFFYKGVKNLYNNIFTFTGSIMVFIIFFTIFNLITTSIWERTSELGTVSALGISARELTLSLILESLLIAVVAAILSTLAYAATSIGLGFAEILMLPPPGFSTGYPLQIKFSVDVIVVISLITLAVSAISAYAAGSRLSKLNIVKALSHI